MDFRRCQEKRTPAKAGSSGGNYLGQKNDVILKLIAGLKGITGHKKGDKLMMFIVCPLTRAQIANFRTNSKQI